MGKRRVLNREKVVAKAVKMALDVEESFRSFLLSLVSSYLMRF